MIYIYLRTNTRLGNWMFQYAAAASLGNDEIKFVSQDPKVIELYSQYKNEVFHGTELVTDMPCDLPVYEEKGFAYEPIARPVASDFVLSGFFQSARYFDEGKIRSFFAPSESRKKEIMRLFGDFLSRRNVTGISVRRTDYMTNAQYHPFCGKQYYRDCIAKLPEVKDFIVCSDDIAWCRSWFAREFPERNFFFVENAGILNQLYVHAFCKNIIMSNSSFCWWPAWLNENTGKRVFAPSMWFGYAYGRQGVNWHDIYFDGVEIVENRYTVALFLRGLFSEFKQLCKIYAVKARRRIIGR